MIYNDDMMIMMMIMMIVTVYCTRSISGDRSTEQGHLIQQVGRDDGDLYVLHIHLPCLPPYPSSNPSICSDEYDDKEEAGLRAMEYGDLDEEAPSATEVRRKVSKLSSLSGAGSHVYTEFSSR